MLEPNAIKSSRSIESIWDLRNAGRVSEAYDAYLEFCQQFSVRPGGSAEFQYLEMVRQTGPGEEQLDFLLLEVSFLRRRMQIELAETRIREIGALLPEGQALHHFQYNFQKGLNALYRGNFFCAMEHFFTARNCARNSKEYHLSFINLILCMEDLSYDYVSQLEKFERTFLPLKQEPWASNVFGQYRTLKLRSAYRTGSFSQVEELLREPPADEEGSYFLMWVLSLPFFSFIEIKEACRIHQDYLAERLNGHLVPFRIRTLKGLLIQDDLETDVRLSTLLERYYLWTWQWLSDPSDVKLDKVLQMKGFICKKTKTPLTAIDFAMLENASRWLGLFHGVSDKFVRSSLSHLSHPLPVALPMLEYERLLLDCSFALRDGKESLFRDTLLVLSEHPLNREPRCLFGGLVQALSCGQWTQAPEPLKILAQSLQGLAGGRQGKMTEGLVVDMLTKRVLKIENKKVTEEIRSTSLTQLVYLLLEKRPLRVAEVLNACFRLPRYDSFVHDPKLANLLNRANKIFRPFLRVTRKEGHIFGEFDSEKILLHAAVPHTLILSEASDLFEKSLPSESEEPIREVAPNGQSVLPPSLASGWVSRLEVQSFLGLSRTSTNRKINTWLKDKLVNRKGIGKASRYRFSEKLLNDLRTQLERGYS